MRHDDRITEWTVMEIAEEKARRVEIYTHRAEMCQDLFESPLNTTETVGSKSAGRGIAVPTGSMFQNL